MANIVIDARESGTSTGRYIDKLIENLAQLKTDHKFTVLVKPHRLDYIAQIAPRFQAVSSPYKEFTFDEQNALRKQITSLHADLVHFSMVQQPIWYKGRTVTTIHDLTTVRFTNPAKNILVFKAKQQVYKYVIKKAAKKASFVMTPTAYVENDVAQFTHIDLSKIKVTYESADAIVEDAEPIKALEGKKFIMYVGRPTPHKNLERLIQAFEILKGQQPELVLALAGKTDANYERIAASVAKQNIDGVYFTDFITDGQLRWMYEHCAAYVFPSLSEGFGLPGLEAMIHGAPVVSSDATCLPEVYGDAARYFDPLDVQAMATAIKSVFTDDAMRTQLINAGTLQVAKYSWRRMAEQTLAVYDLALKS